MGARKSINRYRTEPYGYDYKDVLNRGKRFYTYNGYHDNFEMQPFVCDGRIQWSAESETLHPFTAPKGTVKVKWNGKRWVQYSNETVSTR